MGSRLLIKIQTVRSLYTFEPNSLNNQSIFNAAEPLKGKNNVIPGYSNTFPHECNNDSKMLRIEAENCLKFWKIEAGQLLSSCLFFGQISA